MKILLILVFLFTINCSNNKVVNNHGVTALDVKANKVKILNSNKNDVLKILGIPSTKSYFDENLWFYIERKNINQSVFKLGKSKIKTNNVLELSFNEQGIVLNKKLYNVENMNDLKIAKDITSKKYDENSKIGNLFKSLEQKINSPKRNRSK